MNHPTESLGLLGPERLPSTRRLRTLGIGATIRHFNDRAVPGMGGVWFAKQLVLALFGVQMAQRTGRSKVEVANAIEALGCWLAIKHRSAAGDPRVRGARKLSGTSDEAPGFDRARKRGFYVSQPMRMATVQALSALGLVSASTLRFNAFECSAAGEAILENYVSQYRPFNGDLDSAIERWIRGGAIRPTPPLFQALDPRHPLPERVRALLVERLKHGRPDEPDENRRRRRNALALVEHLRTQRSIDVDWTRRPRQIESESHWHDLEAGRRLFVARDAALALLVALETVIPADRGLPIDGNLLGKTAPAIAALQAAAQAFLDTQHENVDANRFCLECAAKEPAQVIRSLVDRDGLVLVRSGEQIAAGPLYSAHSSGSATESDEPKPGGDNAEDEDAGPRASVRWPPGMSFRMNHLFLLNLDLQGELTKEIGRSATTDGDAT